MILIEKNSENVMVINFTLSGGYATEFGCHGGGGLALIVPEDDPFGAECMKRMLLSKI